MEKILQQICGFFHTLPEPIRRISRSFKSVIHSPLAAIWKLSPHHCWMHPWFSIMQFLALPEILFPLMGILDEGGQPLFIQLSVHSESTCILHRLAEGSGGNSFRSDDIMLFDKWWINYFLFFRRTWEKIIVQLISNNRSELDCRYQVDSEGKLFFGIHRNHLNHVYFPPKGLLAFLQFGKLSISSSLLRKTLF